MILGVVSIADIWTYSMCVFTPSVITRISVVSHSLGRKQHHMNYVLNSFEGVYLGDYTGEYYRGLLRGILGV